MKAKRVRKPTFDVNKSKENTKNCIAKPQENDTKPEVDDWSKRTVLIIGESMLHGLPRY